MSIFSRFTDIMNANINSMLDKAENPEKILRLIIQEMEETLVDVRKSAAKNLADKKGLLRQIRSLESGQTQWQQKAEVALNKNREDLARSALVEKQKLSAELESAQKSLAVIEDNLTLVQEDSQRLQEKLNEAKRRQESLQVRNDSVVVRLKVREKLDSHNIDSAISKYERYQQKIDSLEAQVEAYDLTGNSTDLAKEIDALQSQDSVEDELNALKKKAVNG